MQFWLLQGSIYLVSTWILMNQSSLASYDHVKDTIPKVKFGINELTNDLKQKYGRNWGVNLIVINPSLGVSKDVDVIIHLLKKKEYQQYADGTSGTP